MDGLMSNPDKGAEAIMQMIKAGTETKEYVKKLELPSPLARALTTTGESGLKDRLKEWLQKALDLAKEFNPDSYTVILGVPYVGSIGFSWSRETTK
jgi:hypothetical protein